MSFVDLILEKRIPYLKSIEKRIKNILTNKPIDNLKKLMLAKNVEDAEEIIESFIENAKKEKYFKEMYEKIRGKPFCWETLKEINEIAGISKIYHDSVLTPILQINAVIDRLYAHFLEPLRCFPKIYSSGNYPEGFSLEPNCVGASQIIVALYSFDHDINDLSFVEVYSSKRTENLLKKLKEIEENKDSHTNCVFNEYFSEYTEANIDTFSGWFRKEDFKNMCLDQILAIEEFTHGAIKNKKTSEIYDYELERENYKGIIEREVKEGLFYSTFSNLLVLMESLGYNKKELLETFDNFYKNYKDGVLVNSVGLNLYGNVMNEEKARLFLEKIKKIYDKDLPAKYHVVEILLDYPYMQDNKMREKIKNKISYLKEKYVLPEALQHISERYCHNDLLVKLDNDLN